MPQPSSSASRITGSSQSGGATTTIASIQPQASSRSRLSARSGLPPSGANAFGRSAESRSPRPAAAITAQTDTGRRAERYALAPAVTFAVFFLPLPETLDRTSSSQTPASSSSIALAYISSLARIFFAFTNICFSPVDRPFS